MIKSLDIGCGSCCRCDYGIDTNFDSVSTFLLDTVLADYGFIKNSKAKLIKQDITYGIPFKDNSFDKILICHALEHFTNPYAVLIEVQRVLKRKGTCLIVIPNPRRNNADKIDKTHLYSWTEWALENLLSRFLKVKKIEYLINDIDILALTEREK